MVDLARSYTQRKHQLSIAPPLGTGGPEALPTLGYNTDYINLVQTNTAAEFMSTVALPCSEATGFAPIFPDHWFLVFGFILEPGLGGVMQVLHMTECPRDTYLAPDHL